MKAMGIEEVLSSPRSPWQSAYVARVIGTIRRECLDDVIVLNEALLYRHVKSFLAYYHESRTHLSLGKDTPEEPGGNDRRGPDVLLKAGSHTHCAPPWSTGAATSKRKPLDP